LLTVKDLREFVDYVEELEDRLRWAKAHISKIVKEKRPFTEGEIECLKIDGLLEEDVEE